MNYVMASVCCGLKRWQENAEREKGWIVPTDKQRNLYHSHVLVSRRRLAVGRIAISPSVNYSNTLLVYSLSSSTTQEGLLPRDFEK